MTASAKPKSKSAKKSNSSTGLWLVGGAVLLLALVVIILVLNQQQSAPSSIAAPDVPAEWINGTSIGNPEATVVVQGWEDFLCPACQQWTREVKPTLFERYVNTGDVRFEFHQFPLSQHYPGALQAAMASQCVADLNEFWPYHDRVFQAATSRGQAGTEVEALIGYARELGIDENAVRSCMNNLTHQTTVLASLEQARQLGLSSTPSIIVDGQLVSNPFNFNALAAQIDSALAANASN